MSRKTDLAKIHMGKKQLRLDDDTYRTMLEDMFDVSSAAYLEQNQRAKLIALMKQRGAEFFRKNHRRDPPDPLSRKLRALWLSLYKAGIVRDGSDQALNKYIMRQVKVRSMGWLDTPKAIAVIESLKKWKEREGLDHED